MNRIFRKVWRPTLGQWVVASEFAKRPGGAGPVRMAAGDRTHVNAVAAAVLLALGACPDRALALDAVCRDPATGVAVGNAGAAGDQVACGQGAVAGGTSAVAIGIDVLAGTSSSVAIGDRAQATGLSATAIGLQAVATGRYSVALGAGADALGELAYAMGNEARANTRDIAIGAGALSSSSGSANGSMESVAIGSQAGMNATNVARSTFVGANAGATSVGAENTYIGYQAGAETNGTRNAYAGYNAGLTSQGSFNVAAGNYAFAAANGSFNVAQGAGAGALVTGSHNVAIGDHAGTRAQLDANGNPVGMTASSYSHSVNIGSNTQALADEAVAIGRASTVASQQGTAVGASSQAAGLAGTALGFGSSAAGTYSVAVGDSTAGAANSVAVGRNASASATDATAIGGADAPADAARAQGARSTALGWGATAAATGSISVGDSSANTQNTIAIGTGATAAGTGAIEGAVAIGYNARATQYLSLALGTRSTASNYWAIAIGDMSTASGSDSLAVGSSALASGAASTAVGVLATAAEESAVAIGGGSRATGEQSIAIGGGDYATTSMSDGASASGDRATSIGYRAVATAADGVALGSRSVANTAAGIAGYDPRTGLSSNDASPAWTSTLAAVSVGGAGQTRQITNVAAGTQDTDAVNVAQLQAAQTHYYSVNDDGTPGTNYNNEGATAEQALAAGVSARATDIAATAVGFDSQASGANAIAIGTSSRATQTYSTALGYSATATGQSGVAIGFAAQAVGAGNIAIGHGSETGTATDATAIGVFAVANGASAVALGSAADAEGADAIAIGTGASAMGERSISIGTGNVVNGARSGAIGDPSIIDADDSYSVGNNNTLGAAANNSFVLGNNVSIDVDNATALGNATSVTHAGGVALGSQSVASTASGAAGYDPRTGLPSTDTSATWVSTLAAVSVGSAGNTRQITNVAAGSQATDAVNVAQLQAAQTHYYSVNDDGVVGDNYNNDGATGINALAAGVGASASGARSVAIGYNAMATGAGTAAVGNGAGRGATGTYNALFGEDAGAQSTGNQNAYVGFGAGAFAEGDNNATLGAGAGSATQGNANVAVGYLAGGVTTGHANVATGAGAGYSTTGDFNVASGASAGVGTTGNDNVAIGRAAGTGYFMDPDTGEVVDRDGNPVAGSPVARNQTVAIGNWAVASADGAVAVGAEAQALAGRSVAMGTGAIVSAEDSVALGANSMADGSTLADAAYSPTGNAADIAGVTPIGEVSVGSSGSERRITNVAAGANATDAVNVSQLTAVETIANAGWNVTDADGNAANIGPNGTVTFQGDANLTVTQTGADDDGVVEIALNRDLDVDSVTAGDSTLDTDGLTVDDGAGNVSTVGAGTVSVTDANGTTAIGGNAISVGGANPIVISGDTGTIGGLTNTTWDPDNFTSGQAATEDQLALVSNAANAGWNVTDADGNAANIGPNGTVTFQGDANLTVTQTGADDDGVVEIALNRDLDVDSVTAGDSTLDTDGLTVDDGAGNVSTVGAGTIGVTDANGTTAIGGNAISVGGANPIVISGDTGTIGGLTNTTWDPDNFTSGQAATEDQLALVGSAANAGWNATDAAGNTANIGPNGTVTFESGDANIVVSQTGVDDDGVVDITLSNTLDLTAAGSVTIGDTAMNGAGVAVGTTVTLGNAGLSVIGGTTTTVVNGDGLTSGSVVVSGVSNDVTGLSNTTLTDPTFATAGRAATEEQLQRVDQVANAGWNATDAAGNTANIGPGGTVRFQGDANLAVSQTGADDGGVVDITLNRDLDVDSVTAGNAVVDDSGLTITGGPSVTTAGIDAGGTVITNVAAGVAATDAVNVSQLTAVETVANAGWNATDAAGNTANIGPDGRVRFESGNANIAVSQTGVDDDGVVDVTLSDTLDLSASGSVTTGQTVLNNAGVTVGTNVALGSGGLTVIGGTTTTVLSGSGLTSGNVVLSGTSNTLAGLSNRTLFDPTFATAGRAATEEQLRQVRNEITSGFTPPTRYYGVNSLGGGNQLGEGATGEDAMALGKDATSDGQDAVAMGRGARATEDDSMALGAGSQALSLNALALGAGAVASHENSIALGAGSATTVGARADYQGAYVGSSSSSGEMNIGGRQLTGVAAGSAATDAVNVSQLQGGVTHAINEANAYTDARIATIEGDLVDIRGDITDIQGDIVRIEGDITNLDTRVGDVEGSVANLTTTVNQFDNRVTNLERGGSGPFRITQGETYVAPAPTGANASAGGNGAVASGDNSTAVGNQSVASGDNSTAIGQGAVASHDNSVALGRGSATTVGAQRGYNAAYVGTSTSTGEVNLGGRTISGVAPGIAGTDAVNVNQLDAGVDYAINQANAYTDDRFTRFDGDMWNLERGYRGGTASAMAMAGLPQAYPPGKSMLSVAFGGYQGEYGMAFGLSTITDNGRWVYKAQATGNTTRDWGFSVGAGLQW